MYNDFIINCPKCGRKIRVKGVEEGHVFMSMCCDCYNAYTVDSEGKVKGIDIGVYVKELNCQFAMTVEFWFDEVLRKYQEKGVE